jgi:hypothetical protein
MVNDKALDDSPAMMALPTPDPSSAWWVTMFLQLITSLISALPRKRNVIADLDTHFPFSPKMSTKASWIRSANPGYFYQEDSRLISFLSSFNPRSTSGQTYVVKRTIGTDGTSLLEVPLLADDGGDTTGTQSCRTSTDQLGQVSEKDSLLQGGLETEEVGKDSDDGEELVSRVATRMTQLSYRIEICS